MLFDSSISAGPDRENSRIFADDVENLGAVILRVPRLRRLAGAGIGPGIVPREPSGEQIEDCH